MEGVIPLILSIIASSVSKNTFILIFTFEIALKKNTIQKNEYDFFWQYYLHAKPSEDNIKELYPEFKNVPIAILIKKKHSLIKQINLGLLFESKELQDNINEFIKLQITNISRNYEKPITFKQLMETSNLPVPILIRSLYPLNTMNIISYTANTLGIPLHIEYNNESIERDHSNTRMQVYDCALKGKWMLIKISTHWNEVRNVLKDLWNERKVSPTFRLLIDCTFLDKIPFVEALIFYLTEEDSKSYTDIWEP